MSTVHLRWLLFLAITAAIAGQNFIPDGLFFSDLKDFFHYIVFTLAAILLLVEIKSQRTVNHIIIVAVIFILAIFGGVIEIVQPYFQSDQSLGDFLYDIAGATTGCLIFLAARKSSHRYKQFLLLGAITGLAILPLILAGRALWLQKQQMPLLMDFEQPALFTQLRWSNPPAKKIQMAVPEWTENPSHIGVLELKGKGWANFGLENFPTDWRNYRHLCLDLFSPNTHAIPINIRIIDAEHNWEYEDRFNKNILLQPGFNPLKIPVADIEKGPKTRKLDLSRVKEILLFGKPREDQAKVYVDNIRLEH